MKIYFRKSAVVYHEDQDQIQIWFDRPGEAERIGANVICEIGRGGELVRVQVQDHKRLRLRKRLEAFTQTEEPPTWSWGYITYDETARIGTFYLTSWPGDGTPEQVRRRAICEIDAQGRLLGIMIPVGGRDGEWLLRTATGRLPAASRERRRPRR
ncbi:MAG: hypothetical protein GXP39_13935 [Chloroflexi bacterium]|nr:hypothetical protein [Chloroflexota bacterium]